MGKVFCKLSKVLLDLCHCMYIFKAFIFSCALCCSVHQASHCSGFSDCSLRALERGFQGLQFLGSRAQAQYLEAHGSSNSTHVGSSWTRDRSHVSCIHRQFFTTEPSKPFHYVLLRKNLKSIISR